MAERAVMPTFVPRTVASFERAATVVARRVAAPVRTLAGRALSFADRLVGMWAAGPTLGGLEGGARPSLRAAGRSGGMPLPRPWYELAGDEDAVAPQQARAMIAAASVATSPRPTGVAPVAERGAAIERTTLTTPPELAATTAAATTPTARATIEAGGATTPAAMTSSLPATGTTTPMEDVRVAEALGLRRPMDATPTAVARPAAVAPGIARAMTPLARALAHAAWVDAQLRAVTPSVEATARATDGLVFVAPADLERPMAPAFPSTVAKTVAPSAAPAAMGIASATHATSRAIAPMVPPAAASAVSPASVAAWSAALPDPRLPVAMPTAIAQRVAEFVAGLVGAQSERDAAPTSAAPASTPDGVGTTRPTAQVPHAGVERTFVVVAPTVSWRPGAAAARVERLGEHIDARAMAAWGAPAVTMPPTAEGRAATAAGALATPTASATAPRAVPSVERTMVAEAPASARATGAARLAAFVQRLVGVQAARETAPLPLEATIAREGATPASARAPERVTLAAPERASLSTADRVTPAAARMMLAAPGAIARRAEQLGGMVGVRAASLSIDFVDPSRLSLLTATSATPSTASAAADTIMPVPRPLFAMSPAAPSLTSEEWSLVATFPSAATAVQLAAARQSRQWTAPEQMLLGQVVRAQAATLRGGAPSEYVAPAVVAASETQARLPGGRTPRGSFTWPKLAETTPSRAEWTAPATVTVAELAKQAAPGMPLWGALPPLVAVAPSLAARASAIDPAVLAPAGAAVSATPTSATRDAVPAAAVRDAAAVRGAAATPDARGEAPAMTLMTAAATRDARAAARTGARGDGARGDGARGDSTLGDGRRGEGVRTDGAPSGEHAHGDGMRGQGARTDGGVMRGGGELRAAAMPLTTGGGEAARGGAARAISNVRSAPAMPLMTTAASTKGAAAAAVGPAARALELARPFLRLVEGGFSGSDGGPRASSAPRFFEQPQPLVAGAPASDSASRIVEALRAQPAASASDDRVSLADLTLIAMASATQQVAATPAGGGPRSSSSSPPSSSSSSAAASERGAGKSGNPAQEIEELARAAFDELQRLFAIARERSGEHG